jgi:hypothetical protein
MKHSRQQLTFTLTAILILIAIALGTLITLRFIVTSIEAAINPPPPGGITGGRFNIQKYESLEF